MLNAVAVYQFAENTADVVGRLLLVFGFYKHKFAVFHVVLEIQTGVVLIDAFGVSRNHASFLLPEDFIEYGDWDNPAVNHLPEHIAGADTLQLIDVAYQDNFCPWLNTAKKLAGKPHINHRSLVNDDETCVQWFFARSLAVIHIFSNKP